MPLSLAAPVTPNRGRVNALQSLCSQLRWAHRKFSSLDFWFPPPVTGTWHIYYHWVTLRPIEHCKFRHDQMFWSLRDDKHVWPERRCCNVLLGSSAAFQDRSEATSHWLCGGGLLLFVDMHGASFQLWQDVLPSSEHEGACWCWWLRLRSMLLPEPSGHGTNDSGHLPRPLGSFWGDIPRCLGLTRTWRLPGLGRAS